MTSLTLRGRSPELGPKGANHLHDGPELQAPPRRKRLAEPFPREPRLLGELRHPARTGIVPERRSQLDLARHLLLPHLLRRYSPVRAERRTSIPDPVLDRDARDALVLPLIPGDHRCPTNDRDRSDEQIGVREPLPLSLEERLRLAEDLDRGLIEPEDRQGREKARHERPVLLRRDGLGRSVVELGGRDPRCRHIFGRRGTALDDRGVAPENGNAGVGVEEPQNSTPRPEVRRFMSWPASVARSLSDSHFPASLRQAAS